MREGLHWAVASAGKNVPKRQKLIHRRLGESRQNGLGATLEREQNLCDHANCCTTEAFPLGRGEPLASLAEMSSRRGCGVATGIAAAATSSGA